MMRLKDYIFSSENIYLAIYEVESYVFEKNLLSLEDRELLNTLADPFNEKIIKETIDEVKNNLNRILCDNELFDVQVYFKPKKIIDKTVEYRPIHSAKLIDLISMVSMLHALIYEIPKNDFSEKINLSNYSRLIPNNFYGNRVSKKPESLFLNWSESYKEYTQRANDYFSTFHKTNEYKYELKMDLKQFFPSVNPSYIYKYLLDNVPVTLEEDISLLKKIIFKLLVCNVTNITTPEAKSKYYNDNNVEITKTYTKGIAQGLPQSYFFGNMVMIEIAKLFNKEYEGKAVYYVDDSYVYTNKINSKNDFIEKIKKLNDDIKVILSVDQRNNDFESLCYDYSCFSEMINHSQSPYLVQIHQKEKSSFFNIEKAKTSEIRLHTLSREASCMGVEINSAFSDEEDKAILNRISALINIVERELQEIENQGSKNSYGLDFENYKDKLIRYKKYFKYRELKQRIKLETNILNESIVEILVGEKIKKHNRKEKSCLNAIQNKNNQMEACINNKDEKKLTDIIETFIKNYKDDIWQVAVDISISNDLIKEDVLKKYLNLVIQILYTDELENCSYISKYYSNYLNNFEIDTKSDCYDYLRKQTKRRLEKYSKLSFEMIYKEFIGARFAKLDNEILSSFNILNNDFMNCITYVDVNSDRLKRMFLNAVYSQLFKLTLTDDFILNCYDKKGISYGVLRIMIFLRNPRCNLKEFINWRIDLTLPENKQKIDYTILEVLQVYQKYIKHTYWVDDLIQIHRYTSDVWKNGAKHLYFYTLHNQEHAIDLIKNIVKLIKVFSYFNISEYDYYLLFISSYLHDISMVKTASSNDFLLDKSSDKITYELSKKWGEAKNLSLKKEAIINAYKCLDEFFENKIRSNHGRDSGEEIRTRDDLQFLEQSVREIVAEISESHTMDVRDIYFVKGDAKSKLVSLKFDKIILRLADLLDMSENRISKPILNHNMDNISQESAFHWISHLLTNGYEITTDYILNDDNETKNQLEPGSIDENITLKIYIRFSQWTKVPNSLCQYMKIDEESLSNTGFRLVVIEANKTGEEKCQSDKCNFLCKWFNKKNEYLIQEINALNSYFKRIPDDERFFNINVSISVEVVSPTSLPDDQFDIIKKYLLSDNK